MNNSDIKNLSLEQLSQQIAEEKSRLQKLKFAHAITPIENPNRIKESRKIIARLSTELTAKSKAEA